HQLDPHGAAVLALAVLLGSAKEAELVLDGVPVLVCDDVFLGQGPAVGAEPTGERGEEAGVDVDLLVHRAVERADLVGRGSTCGLRDAGVQHRLDLAVGLAETWQLFRPEVLHAVDRADDAALHVTVGVGARLALGEAAALGATGLHLSGVEPGVLSGVDCAAWVFADAAPEQQCEDQQDDAAGAATDDQAAAGHTRPAPAALDLGGIEVGIVVEAHGFLRISSVTARTSSPLVIS